jgi:transposase InsO family protein
MDGMCGVTPEIRELIVKARRNGKRVKDIAEMFDVNRKTVWKWCKRTMRVGRPVYRDRSKKPYRVYRKITPTVEEAILLLRDNFQWGTQRIMIALLSPPPYIRYFLETATGKEWKNIKISRQAINNILQKHKMNGSPYKKTRKDWNFFTATGPNEMWQIDIKGPFLIDGKRLNALLILDDYSRFLISVKLFKSITTDVVTQALGQCISTYNSPGKILSDNGPQFRETFEKWCSEPKRKIDVVHAPPFYPQCKGKIERCIRNFNEEYIRLDKVFEDISTFVKDYQEWYNNERFNSGISDIPVNLYLSENVTDVT